jgi:hypothetical protein
VHRFARLARSGGEPKPAAEIVENILALEYTGPRRLFYYWKQSFWEKTSWKQSFWEQSFWEQTSWLREERSKDKNPSRQDKHSPYFLLFEFNFICVENDDFFRSVMHACSECGCLD